VNAASIIKAIALMMESVSISESSLNLYQTTRRKQLGREPI
jgi:hypothetical protein